jgi:hypothetical protein
VTAGITGLLNCAMVDTYDVDRPGGLVDPVDHPVRAAPPISRPVADNDSADGVRCLLSRPVDT